jgi:hypothetical protein
MREQSCNASAVVPATGEKGQTALEAFEGYKKLAHQNQQICCQQKRWG